MHRSFAMVHECTLLIHDHNRLGLKTQITAGEATSLEKKDRHVAEFNLEHCEELAMTFRTR